MLATYRQLTRFERRIAETHRRITVQKARVCELEDATRRRDAEGLLWVLEQSLRVMTQYRNILIQELIRWPHRS
jgi:hypothetical protein